MLPAFYTTEYNLFCTLEQPSMLEAEAKDVYGV